MAEWINTPLILVVVITVLGIAVKFGRWQGTVDTSIKNIGDTLKEIKSSIERIFDRLPRARTADGNSPLSLNALGKRVAKDLGAAEWATNLAPSLLDEVKDKQQFEIDNYCSEYVTSSLFVVMEKRISECAYNHGLNRGDIYVVLHITLRDELIRLTEQ